jgi:hypothetical protein
MSERSDFTASARVRVMIEAKDTTDSDIEEMVNLRRKLGLVTP